MILFLVLLHVWSGNWLNTSCWVIDPAGNCTGCTHRPWGKPQTLCIPKVKCETQGLHTKCDLVPQFTQPMQKGKDPEQIFRGIVCALQQLCSILQIYGYETTVVVHISHRATVMFRRPLSFLVLNCIWSLVNEMFLLPIFVEVTTV